MHDDKQIYFIYLIIENLDAETRKNQVRSKTMQLGFLSIMKLKNIKIKIEVYHRALKVIFKHKLQFERYNTSINNNYSY